MRAERLPTLTRHWHIGGTVPNPRQEHKHYGENFYIGVEAQSMEKALEAARIVYPDATFISCNHRGDVHIRAEVAK